MEHFPCTPEQRANCPVLEAEGDCYEDVHHEYWPKSQYRTKIEREFRSLDENKILACRALHNEIHARRRASEKPSRNEMLRIINESKENHD